MPFDVHGALLVAVVAGVTALIRFLPFVVFGGGRPTPKFVVYLAGVLPCAIMAMLVVYCLRGVDLLGPAPCGSAPSLPTGLRWNIIWMPSRRRMPSTPRCSRRWQKAGLPGMDFKLPFSQAVCACTLEIKGVFFDGTECKRPAQGHAGPIQGAGIHPPGAPGIGKGRGAGGGQTLQS